MGKLIQVLFIFLCFAFALKAQQIAVFEDDRRHLFVFENLGIKKIEYIPVSRYYVGKEYVAYINNLNEFKIYYKGKKYLIMSTPPDTIVAQDYLLGYVQANQLGVFNGRESRTIQTWIEPQFYLGDSLFTFIDNFQAFRVYENEENKKIETWATGQFWAHDNIAAYVGNQGDLKVYYRGETRVLESYKSDYVKIAKDIIAYNDYKDFFKIFSAGEQYDMENYKVYQYEVGNGFAVYYNNINEWIGFYGGERIQLLPTKPKFFNI
ncbi:MAG: hypothetical protein IPK03_09420 [Bacteroidetes bacterium]|nr:hypothetical protein [Bacteroidota bacterium]